MYKVGKDTGMENQESYDIAIPMLVADL